ncbi:MAG: hypothetical protein JWP50_1992 [Phenylobacterium sp.]|nr:hypothetical protein [Phenylobacterium sp.]
MTDKPPAATDDDKLPEAEADERFKRLVGNLVNTPPQPHKPKDPEEPLLSR